MKLKLTKKKKDKIISSAIIAIVVIFIFLAIMFILDILYVDKFYPGVKVAGVKISDLTYQQANKIFNAKLDELHRDGQKFIYQNHGAVIYPVVVSATDPDLSREIISFKLNETLKQAYILGRAENFFNNIWQKIKLLFINKNFAIQFNSEDQEIEKILINYFKDLERPGHNPQLAFKKEEIEIIKEKTGLIFDYSQAMAQLQTNLAQLDFKPIAIHLELEQPEFTTNEALGVVGQVEEVINLSPITISAITTDRFLNEYKTTWTLTQDEIQNWLNFGWHEKNKKPELTFKPDEVEKFLDSIKHQIERPVKEAKFSITDNWVTEFQGSQVGQEINLKATLKNFKQNIIVDKQPQAQIIINQIEPEVATESINDMGIKSLIGVGTSDFSGSSNNRKLNIQVGADSLNGLLIEPGMEFSLAKVLGDITADKGYVPEFVIKGTETIPEYGGGLCQIATTAFRLALNAGLEVTARKPHAYRVGYYEPAGTDATIYAPWPDLRFINDTPNYLLLQTRIEGNDAIFELWGTHDGRQVATTSPSIYNIVSPGATKYIETADIPEDTIKCIESAHHGADTHFNRTITYANGEVKEEIWESHYRPWQAVCLVGVDPAKLATSTPEITE